jgi:hypothetical protein
MRLFAYGRQRPGAPADLIIEIEGARLNLTLASRVRAERHARARIHDARDTMAATVRDRDAVGELDVLEQGRV